MQGTTLLPLLPGPLGPWVVAHDRVLSMGWIELNRELVLNWIVWNRTVHLPPISKTIQIKRTRYAGHRWRSKYQLISDVFLWTPSHGHESVGWPAKTYPQQLYMDTECCLKELPEAMDNRNGNERDLGKSVGAARHDDDDDDVSKNGFGIKNLQWLICHKTEPKQSKQKFSSKVSNSLYLITSEKFLNTECISSLKYIDAWYSRQLPSNV